MLGKQALNKEYIWNCLKTVSNFVHVVISSVKMWGSATIDTQYIFLYSIFFILSLYKFHKAYTITNTLRFDKKALFLHVMFVDSQLRSDAGAYVRYSV
jgi:hypothetical protein